jgi:hypothetical protein
MAPSDFAGGPRREPTIRLYNQFSKAQTTDRLRETFARPLWDRFPDCRITNYGDAVFDRVVTDHNGAYYASAAISDEASPSLYHTPKHHRYLLEAIAEAMPRTPVPWVPFASKIGREAFTQTVHDAYARGVRTFLYFNPHQSGRVEAVDDDTFARKVFGSLPTADANTLRTPGA